MAAVELATGQRVWEVNIAGISTPWAAGDWVYVVTSDARLLCLSRGTGKIRWATQLPAYKNEKKRKNPIRWSGPVLASEGLFLVSTQGQMISVSPFDGEIASRTKLSDGSHLSPIVANNTRSEEHTSELQSLMRISYAVFCFKKKKKHKNTQQ